MTVVVVQGETYDVGNGGRQLLLNLYTLRFALSRNSLIFLVKNDVMVQGMIT